MPHLEDYLKRIIGEVIDIFLDNVVDETYNVNKEDFCIYFDNDIDANPFVQYLTYGKLSERNIGHTFSLSAKESCSLKISNIYKMIEFKERFDIFIFEFDTYRDIEVNLILSDKEFRDLFIKAQTVTFLSDNSRDKELKLDNNFVLYCDICVIDSYNSCNLAGYPQIKDKLIIRNSEYLDKDYFHLSKENYIIQGRNNDLSVSYNRISVNTFLEDINMREFRWTNQYVQALNKTIKQITYAQK